MKIINLLIVCFLFPIVTFAQLSVLRDSGTGQPIITNPYKEVKGTPYISEFNEGTIVLLGGQLVEGLQIALNGYEQTLEYKLDGNLFGYSPENLKGFFYRDKAGNLVQFTSDFEIPSISKQRFLQELETGKYHLLKYPYKIMADDVTAAYGSQSLKVFQMEEEFLIGIDGKAFILKKNTKNFQEIFGEEEAKALRIIKENKLSLKSEADIRKLVQLMNEK